MSEKPNAKKIVYKFFDIEYIDSASSKTPEEYISSTKDYGFIEEPDHRTPSCHRNQAAKRNWKKLHTALKSKDLFLSALDEKKEDWKRYSVSSEYSNHGDMFHSNGPSSWNRLIRVHAGLSRRHSRAGCSFYKVIEASKKLKSQSTPTLVLPPVYQEDNTESGSLTRDKHSRRSHSEESFHKMRDRRVNGKVLTKRSSAPLLQIKEDGPMFPAVRKVENHWTRTGKSREDRFNSSQRLMRSTGDSSLQESLATCSLGCDVTESDEKFDCFEKSSTHKRRGHHRESHL